MILSVSQYLCLGTLLVLIVFSVLYAIYGLLSKEHRPFGQSYRNLIDFFVRRTHELFSKGIVIGLFRYIFFFIYLLVLPVLTAYLLSGFLPRIEKISQEDGKYVHTEYIALGTVRLGDESVSLRDRKILCIFNDTDRAFTLRQEKYITPDGYGSDGVTEQPEERVESHSCHLTGNRPDLWFEAPDTIKTTATYRDRILWVIE